MGTIGGTGVWGEDAGRSTLFNEILSLREEVQRFRTDLRAGNDLQAMAERLSCGVCVATLEGRILFANDPFSALHARSRQECLGEELTLFLRPDQHGKMSCLVEGVAVGGAYTAVPLWNVRRDGTAFPTLCSLFSLPGPDASRDFCVLVFMENAPLAAAESAVRGCTALLNGIGEELAVGHLIVDASARIISWSAPAARITGLAPDASTRMEVGLSEIVHPADWTAVNAWIQRSLRGGEPITQEFRILRTDGQVRWAHGSATRQRTLQNAPEAVRIVFQDVTEWRQAERAAREKETEESLYQEVERLGHVGTWHYDAATQRVRWSEGMYALLSRDRSLGPPSLNEMQGFIGIPPSPVVDAMFGAYKRGERMERELTIQLHENDAHRLHSIIHAMYDGEGTLTCLYGIVQQIPPQSQPPQSVPSPSAIMTSRELAVCQLIREGLSTKEIAERLAISAKSVQTHRNHIRRKLGLLNQSVNLAGYLKTHVHP